MHRKLITLSLLLVCPAVYGQTLPVAQVPPNLIYSIGPNTLSTSADNFTPLSTLCTTNAEVWITTAGTYPINTSGALGCHLHFVAGVILAPSTGITLTLNGQIIAPASQIFSGAGTVSFGKSISEVPVEWFGAIGDGVLTSGGSGTDNTTAIQKALNALTSGHILLQAKTYRVTAPLTVNKVGQGILGTVAGYSYPSASPVSIIMSTVSGSDIVDLTGGPWQKLKDFSVQRSVLPTGTSRGISVIASGGLTIDNVQSHDSIQPFYFNAASEYGVGSIRNTEAGWGYGPVTGYTNQTMIGYFLDSANGSAQNTIYIENSGTANNAGSGPTTTAMQISGTAINDVDLEFIGGANTTLGLVINGAGAGGLDSEADIIVHRLTLDGCFVSCVLIQNLTAGSGAPSITITDSYINSNTAGTKIVDIESSNNVVIANSHIYDIAGNASNTGVYMANSSAISVVNDKFQSLKNGSGIIVDSTTGSLVSGNTFSTTSSLALTNAVLVRNTSTGNTVTTNNVSGGYVSTGFAFDSTSLSNDAVGNTCSGSITTCVSGVPLGTAPSYLASGSSMGGSLLCTTATCSGGGGGTGTVNNSGTAGLFSVYPTTGTTVGPAFGVSYLSSGTNGANANCIRSLGAGATYPGAVLLCDIVGSQISFGFNTYYNGSNWIYDTASTAGAFRMGTGPGATFYQMSLGTGVGSTGSTFANMDTTAVTQFCLPGQCWINPQTASPTFPANSVLIVNPSGNFKVDTSGNATANRYNSPLFTPSSSTTACTTGDWAHDANYEYDCVATNTWKRVAISAF